LLYLLLPTFKIKKMEEQNLIKALEAYIEEHGYRDQNDSLLPSPEQHERIERMMLMLHELKF